MLNAWMHDIPTILAIILPVSILTALVALAWPANPFFDSIDPENLGDDDLEWIRTSWDFNVFIAAIVLAVVSASGLIISWVAKALQ